MDPKLLSAIQRQTDPAISDLVRFVAQPSISAPADFANAVKHIAVIIQKMASDTW